MLARFSCNTSGCHGKAEGQNGFKLSVFGFDPDGDHFRVRLTHSLEVAQIGRTIARALGLDEDLTEALCLGPECGRCLKACPAPGAIVKYASRVTEPIRSRRHASRSGTTMSSPR